MSDGGAALVLVSEQGLAELGIPETACVEVAGLGQATSSLYDDGEPTALPTASVAADRAYAQSGIRPGQVGVLERFTTVLPSPRC